MNLIDKTITHAENPPSVSAVSHELSKNRVVDTTMDSIIFYPGYGICHYLNSDAKYHYFKSLILQIKISIPLKTSMHRSLISKEHAQSIKNNLESVKECSFTEVWNRRKKYFMNRIYTGNPDKILEVVQELNFVQTKKLLSYSEKEIHKMAKNLLMDELSVVLK